MPWGGATTSVQGSEVCSLSSRHSVVTQQVELLLLPLLFHPVSWNISTPVWLPRFAALPRALGAPAVRGGWDLVASCMCTPRPLVPGPQLDSVSSQSLRGICDKTSHLGSLRLTGSRGAGRVFVH